MLFVYYCVTACCLKTMFIRHGPLSGSTASTIPATEAQLEAVNSSSSQAAQPPKKNKNALSKDDSAPKESSKRRPRSPTLHYSPPQSTEAPPTKKTAVKAKAAPTVKAKAAPTVKAKAAPTVTAGTSKPAKVSPKAETPDQSTAKAMQSTLHRASTVDLKTAVAAAPEASSDDEDMDDNSSQASECEEENTEGVTVEQLRERKRLHARYMRFSRSLKSSLAAYTTCICTHSQAVHVSNGYASNMIDIIFYSMNEQSVRSTTKYYLNCRLLSSCKVSWWLDLQGSSKNINNEFKLVCTSRHFWKEMIHWFSHPPITGVVPGLGKKCPREIRLAGEAAYRCDLT